MAVKVVATVAKDAARDEQAQAVAQGKRIVAALRELSAEGERLGLDIVVKMERVVPAVSKAAPVSWPRDLAPRRRS